MRAEIFRSEENGLPHLICHSAPPALPLCRGAFKVRTLVAWIVCYLNVFIIVCMVKKRPFPNQPDASIHTGLIIYASSVDWCWVYWVYWVYLSVFLLLRKVNISFLKHSVNLLFAMIQHSTHTSSGSDIWEHHPYTNMHPCITWYCIVFIISGY